MNSRFESPKNCKKTNPIEYNYYENVKERHYLGKYKPDENDIYYKNSKIIPEIETFNFDNNSVVKINNNKDNNDNNASNKLNFAIKSIII